MTKIALLGAGGKMGVAPRLEPQGLALRPRRPVEVAEAGRERLRAATGLDCVDLDQALGGAERRGARGAGPRHRPGRARDHRPGGAGDGAGGARRGRAARGRDAEGATTSPTSSPTPATRPIFNDEDGEARLDFFGGIRAKQHIVCALMQGPEEHYALCEEVAREIYKPVMRSHRVTVEQMAILEPALSETVGATFALALREATRRGGAAGRPGAGRRRLHPRPPEHRARHRLRRVPRGAVLRRRAARHRPGEGPRSFARTGWSACSTPTRFCAR